MCPGEECRLRHPLGCDVLRRTRARRANEATAIAISRRSSRRGQRPCGSSRGRIPVCHGSNSTSRNPDTYANTPPSNQPSRRPHRRRGAFHAHNVQGEATSTKNGIRHNTTTKVKTGRPAHQGQRERTVAPEILKQLSTRGLWSWKWLRRSGNPAIDPLLWCPVSIAPTILSSLPSAPA